MATAATATSLSGIANGTAAADVSNLSSSSASSTSASLLMSVPNSARAISSSNFTAANINEQGSGQGKRKRGSGSIPPSRDDAGINPNGGRIITSNGRSKSHVSRGREAKKELMHNMLLYLKQNDPSPSILHCVLPSAKVGNGSVSTKRTKLNSSASATPSPPLTVYEKFTEGLYLDFVPLLNDISTAVLLRTEELNTNRDQADQDSVNGSVSNVSEAGRDDIPKIVAKMLLFEQSVRELAAREQLRRPDIFNGPMISSQKRITTENVCLTVMSQNGPLFSSLQKGTTIPTPALSSASTCLSSPSSSPTTAATSLLSSPPKFNALGSDLAVVTPIPEHALPQTISATKVHTLSPQGKQARSIVARTIGEEFPPPQHARPIAKPGTTPATAVKGGSGSKTQIAVEDKTRTGEWLSYTNQATETRGRLGSFVNVNSVPKDFVALYTSFAPTKDDGGTALPTSFRNMIWWERYGKKRFDQLFPDWKESIDSKAAALNTQIPSQDRIQDVTEDMDLDHKTKATNDDNPLEDEEVFRKVVESWEPEEPPIDFRLINGGWENEPDATGDSSSFNSLVKYEAKLQRISSLLESLHSQQRIRLSTVPPTSPPPVDAEVKQATVVDSKSILGTPTSPGDIELMLYDGVKKELAQLIGELPPHVVATLDGDRDGELNLSSVIPILSGRDVWKGTLPGPGSDRPRNLQNITTSGTSMSQALLSTGSSIGMNIISNTTTHMQQQQVQSYSQRHLSPQTPVRVPAPVSATTTIPTTQYHQQRMVSTQQQQLSSGYYSQVPPQSIPQQMSYTSFHNHNVPVPTGVAAPQHYQQQFSARPNAPSPRLPQVGPPRVVTPVHQPVVPPSHIPTPVLQQQPQQTYHHYHQISQQQPRVVPSTLTAPMTPQSQPQPQPQQVPHYMQAIQLPPPRPMGPVSTAANTQHYPPQTQQFHHHVQSVATPYHHQNVMRNPYGNNVAASPIVTPQHHPQMPMQSQQQHINYAQNTPQRMSIPPPQGLAAVGYGMPPSTPNRAGMYSAAGGVVGGTRPVQG